VIIRTGHPEPIFILAPPRSYSTVSLAILAGHPECYGFPELLLFEDPAGASTVGALLDAPGSEAGAPDRSVKVRQSGILRALAEIHEGSQADSALMDARRWLLERSAWPTARVLEHMLDCVSPRIGIEKSPETTRSDDSINACLRAYPQARYIHLTRHPVTTQRSMHKHWQQLPGRDHRTLVAEAASWWYLSHSRVVRSLAPLPESQWLRLRAEDLLREPKVHLPRVLDWLGLPCNDEIIARMLRTEDWRFAGTGPTGDLYGGDPQFMLSPALRAIEKPCPVSFDASWGLPAQMQIRMQRLAEYLGY
jgi:Sulfotransferase family